MLRAHYGDDIATVFIGPCIAKKKEAEEHPELLDVVLTFEDLEYWLTRRKHPSCGNGRDCRRIDLRPKRLKKAHYFLLMAG